jgi:dTMP kinase
VRDGLLISFEGIDGCGKSTQLTRVAERLRAAGNDVLTLREPGGTVLGERVRDLLLDPSIDDMDAAAEALLYAASRAELVATTIEPALQRGSVVILDRYVDSSLAYQGAGRGLGIERVLEANLLATRGRLPDATVFVDLDPALAAERLAATDTAPDRLERAGDAFFQRVHGAYLDLARRYPERIHRVDGAGTVDEVATRVWEIVSDVCAATGIPLEEVAAQ